MSKIVQVIVIYSCILQILVSTQNLMGLKSCPELPSKYTNSVDQLLGEWHIAFIILDETEEFFEEQSLCIKGKLMKMNHTTLIQSWNIALPELIHEEKTEIEFLTKIIEPGIWLVKSPLGGELRGTVIDSDGRSYLLVVYCGYHNKNSAHIITVAMSRSHIIIPEERLYFMSILVKHGYDPYQNKIVNWSNC